MSQQVKSEHWFLQYLVAHIRSDAAHQALLEIIKDIDWFNFAQNHNLSNHTRFQIATTKIYAVSHILYHVRLDDEKIKTLLDLFYPDQAEVLFSTGLKNCSASLAKQIIADKSFSPHLAQIWFNTNLYPIFARKALINKINSTLPRSTNYPKNLHKKTRYLTKITGQQNDIAALLESNSVITYLTVKLRTRNTRYTTKRQY